MGQLSHVALITVSPARILHLLHCAREEEPHPFKPFLAFASSKTPSVHKLLFLVHRVAMPAPSLSSLNLLAIQGIMSRSFTCGQRPPPHPTPEPGSRSWSWWVKGRLDEVHSVRRTSGVTLLMLTWFFWQFENLYYCPPGLWFSNLDDHLTHQALNAHCQRLFEYSLPPSLSPSSSQLKFLLLIIRLRKY